MLKRKLMKQTRELRRSLKLKKINKSKIIRLKILREESRVHKEKPIPPIQMRKLWVKQTWQNTKKNWKMLNSKKSN
jgi:hypothetical protein